MFGLGSLFGRKKDVPRNKREIFDTPISRQESNKKPSDVGLKHHDVKIEKRVETQKKREHVEFTSGGDTRAEIPGKNEDAYIIDNTHGIFGVFDGVGGGEHGEQASQLAFEEFGRLLAKAPRAIRMEQRAIEDVFLPIIHEINNKVAQIGESATTATVMKVCEDPYTHEQYAVIVHIGDCRVYHRTPTNQSSRRITRDHNEQYHIRTRRSLNNRLRYRTDPPKQSTSMYAGETMMIDPTLSDAQQYREPLDDWPGDADSIPPPEFMVRSKMISALGGQSGGSLNYVDLLVVQKLQPHDWFLFVSDGVYDNLTHGEIDEILHNASTPQDASRLITKRAYDRSNDTNNRRNKLDDITAVCVSLSEASVPQQKKRVLDD